MLIGPKQFRTVLGLALNADNKTGSIYIIGMATPVHEAVVHQLQNFFKDPNRGVVDDPPIVVLGQPHKGIYSIHFKPNGSRIEIAPDVAIYPDTAFVPRPVNSIIVPHPPSDVD
nr:4701_t:CDS:2 [Entrophospora candida]